jgi:hypothetical protein
MPIYAAPTKKSPLLMAPKIAVGKDTVGGEHPYDLIYCSVCHERVYFFNKFLLSLFVEFHTYVYTHTH